MGCWSNSSGEPIRGRVDAPTTGSQPSPSAGGIRSPRPGVCPEGGFEQEEAICKVITHASASQSFWDAFPGGSALVGLEGGPCGLWTTDH